MFFMMGINQGRKKLDFNQMMICDHCGSYGRFEVYMTYMVLSLFFIPCFKWNKKYYVQSTCCETIYELNSEIGRRIARGQDIKIEPEHLIQIRPGYRSISKRCNQCGYETQEDFEFCPKCGEKFNS